MDKTAAIIVDFVTEVAKHPPPAATLWQAVRHFVDGVGCAAGGFDSQPATIARDLAAHEISDLNASVYGLPEPRALGSAAFANGCANRHLDFNDTYVKIPSGHPNDMVPALFALTEAMGGTGKDFLTSTHVAYEVFAAISDVAPVRDNGWDQGLQCSIGVAAAGSFLMGLDRAETLNAISLAITPCVPLRVVRTGQISQWKGCATAHAGMTAITALRLASRGMSGPADPFEGVDGLMSQATGQFKIAFGSDERCALDRTLIKHVPSELSSQVPVQLALDLCPRLKLDNVEFIEIATHHLGWHEIGGGQGDHKEKWDPRTRETADHSLPYIVAVVLRDGSLTPESFAIDKVRDPALRPLLRKITVTEDPVMTARLRSHRELGARIRIGMTDGSVLEAEGVHPLGSPENPMSDDQVTAKARPMLADVLGTSTADTFLDLLWSIEDQDNVDRIAGYLRRFGER